MIKILKVGTSLIIPGSSSPTTLKCKNTVSSNSTSFFLIINEEKTANPNKTIFYISFVLRELECRNEISFPKSTTDFHMTFSTFS